MTPVALIAAALLMGGCATTSYTPRLVARGELTLEYDGLFAMRAGGRRVAAAPTWGGLAEHVRCVPRAHELATAARSRGQGGIVTRVFGVTFGVLALGGFAGVPIDDPGPRWAIVGSGVASALIGLAMAVSSAALRNGANGRAIDAMNLYNDSVGSLGATCDDLTYPYPVAPVAPQGP